ncbi:hypothetical protein TTHERM_00494120 (macronuclear) [Tetrahymena thermophila SB210]|uniref:Uncharacterized protein n=1 Tax=Tetrahymena thermophila (strain SB210) TaxID=312017 RepID=I7LWW0_TETTS|nr:hypothetical protein TTHERM_00494120 [Tetrahymena thermophila SB210]EAS02960.1 hypothetical protein TTHERM_00494120 [Tetrahymena thermophila SB210]|eukprot:XP_001023205.1 hypothetical protein TTHERM_00494120 [Tetrahymena thermophila SB210]
MSLTKENIQKFCESQPKQEQQETKSQYDLSDYQSEFSLMSNLTAQFTNEQNRQKAKILNKKMLYKKLEDFHKQTFHTLLQKKGKQCHVCSSEQCKLGKMNKLPTVQMMFANVFVTSKLFLSSKKTVSHFVNQKSLNKM